MLRARHLAPGRAALRLQLEDAPAFGVELAFPAPALEPDWIARLLLGPPGAGHPCPSTWERLRSRALPPSAWSSTDLADPASRQLPAFEAQAARWEELRWSLERLAARFGEGRLWRAVHDRPSASLAERRTRLVDIGRSAS